MGTTVKAMEDQVHKYFSKRFLFLLIKGLKIADTEYNYNLVQRQRTMNSFGLGGLTSKYIPVVNFFLVFHCDFGKVIILSIRQQKTRTTMPEYKGLRIVDTQTFFSNFKRGGAPEEAAPQDESAQPKAKPN